MQPIDIIVESDSFGQLTNVPTLPPGMKVKIVLLEPLPRCQNLQQRRRPHPDIAGKIQILGDIINTVSEKDWDLP